MAARPDRHLGVPRELQALAGFPVEPMAKSTFYFVIITLVIVDMAQGRYQKKLSAGDY